ncbi:MarR family transcriptional regulator [Psychromarinibacter sp. C21-152]|uniref:MarR family transcriptional regulator n=1 Tax=Psychromarinibacter sediminicola TaxID=3033385 RepID=A0AAE3NS74_9RHOB|nr:MarR family transcriptional regulator [Psychromarinibacter sediminicola]MDF0601504.1 MarR family transcriptional regulator [Psychromarinibacter sediminicola]
MSKAKQLHGFLWLTRPLMQRVEDMVRRGLEGTGLTVRMRAVLEILDARGALSVPDIARALEVKRQYVQLMVNDVIEAGLAEKRDNPRHRASPLIALTEAGAALISEVLAAERTRAGDLADDFTEEELETALRVAERLTGALSDGDRT